MTWLVPGTSQPPNPVTMPNTKPSFAIQPSLEPIAQPTLAPVLAPTVTAIKSPAPQPAIASLSPRANLSSISQLQQPSSAQSPLQLTFLSPALAPASALRSFQQPSSAPVPLQHPILRPALQPMAAPAYAPPPVASEPVPSASGLGELTFSTSSGASLSRENVDSVLDTINTNPAIAQYGAVILDSSVAGRRLLQMDSLRLRFVNVTNCSALNQEISNFVRSDDFINDIKAKGIPLSNVGWTPAACVTGQNSAQSPTAPPPSSSSLPLPQSVSTPSSGSSTAGIAGGVAGGVAAVVAGLAAFYIWRRKKHGPVENTVNKERSCCTGNLACSIRPSRVQGVPNAFTCDTNDTLTSSAALICDAKLPKTDNGTSALPDNHSEALSSSKSTASTPLADISVLEPRRRSRDKEQATTSRPDTLTVTFEPGAPGKAFAEAEANRSLEEAWKIDASQLKMKLYEDKPIVLGTGGFGSVYLGVLYGLTEVAIKVMNRPTQERQSHFEREIMTLKACMHPNIVQFIGATVQDQQTLLVMQYMPGGNLYDCIHSDVAGNIKWYKKGREIALDIVNGLNYLHSLQIIHLDIKSPNVLLSRKLEAKISDIGLGKAIIGNNIIANQGVSFMWAAPEQLGGRSCSRATDIFALGTVLWEICTGERPIKRQCRPLAVPQEAPQVVNDVISRCRAEDPLSRPSIQEIYNLLAATPEAWNVLDKD